MVQAHWPEGQAVMVVVLVSSILNSRILARIVSGIPLLFSGLYSMVGFLIWAMHPWAKF
jgi:hypothetical protein